MAKYNPFAEKAALRKVAEQKPVQSLLAIASFLSKVGFDSQLWGSIDVGGSSVVTLWVKSNSTIPITLSMSTDSWQPALAGQYLTLTWNYNGAQLLPGQSVPIDLTLQVSPDIHDVADFSFMTTIEMRST